MRAAGANDRFGKKAHTGCCAPRWRQSPFVRVVPILASGLWSPRHTKCGQYLAHAAATTQRYAGALEVVLAGLPSPG